MIIRLILFIAVLNCSVFGLRRGQGCTIERTSRSGICKILDDCPAVIKDLNRNRRITECGFEGQNKVVCCPKATVKKATTPAPEINENSPISQQKCKEYSETVLETGYAIPLILNPEPIKTEIDKCGNNHIPLIVDGVQAKPKEFPHMALVGFGVEDIDDAIVWNCGGTLVSEQFVLTAGHCLYDKSLNDDAKYIRLGELNISSKDDDARPEDFNVMEIIKHPEYSSESKYNDIGILKMDRKVKLNPYIRPACLPTSFRFPESGLIATGWGNTAYARKSSNHLLKVVLTKFSHKECNKSDALLFNRDELMHGIQNKTQMCAGSRNGTGDTCQGDSGGPLQVYHPSLYCMYTIVGITSFGKLCGHINQPAVYTRVFPYVRWIEKVVWGNQ